MQTVNKFVKPLLLLIVLLLFGAFAGTSVKTMAQTPTSVQDLIRVVTEFVQAELSKPGTTVEDPDLGKIFVGEAAARVAEVHERSAKEYDALTARSAEERKAAIAAIQAFAESSEFTPTYLFTSPNPDNRYANSEVYETSGTRYLVDPETNIVMHMSVTDPAWVPTEAKYSLEELEQQAKDYLSKKNSCFEQDQANWQFEKAAKDPENLTVAFFRWNNVSAHLPDGVASFLQVGIAVDGRIVNYTDSGICQVSVAQENQKLYLPVISSNR
jgi:hypothetical protein